MTEQAGLAPPHTPNLKKITFLLPSIHDLAPTQHPSAWHRSYRAHSLMKGSSPFPMPTAEQMSQGSLGPSGTLTVPVPMCTMEGKPQTPKSSSRASARGVCSVLPAGASPGAGRQPW